MLGTFDIADFDSDVYIYNEYKYKVRKVIEDRVFIRCKV